MSRRLLILIPALMALTWMSCTTKRDGRAYRLYHNTTAKYNGFFYANEAHAEAEVKLEELHEERWDEVLLAQLPCYLKESVLALFFNFGCKVWAVGADNFRCRSLLE